VVSQMLKTGIIDPNGKMQAGLDLARVRKGSDGKMGNNLDLGGHRVRT